MSTRNVFAVCILIFMAASSIITVLHVEAGTLTKGYAALILLVLSVGSVAALLDFDGRRYD